MFKANENYRHNKTGNIYEFFANVVFTETKPRKFTTCLWAKYHENGERIKIYYQEGVWYHTNPDFDVLVLYSRDDVLWLREEVDFHRNVLIRGVAMPRFERIDP